MPAPEFIFLNDQAAKVTSLRDDDAGGFTLVTIARGGADRDRMLELLDEDDLQVRLDTGASRPMHTTSVDVRSSGEGPQAIHRIEATLIPKPGSPTPEPGEPIIDRLDRIIDLLTDIRDRMDRESHGQTP